MVFLNRIEDLHEAVGPWSDGTVSRRDFLKLGGLVALSLGLSGSEIAQWNQVGLLDLSPLKDRTGSRIPAELYSDSEGAIFKSLLSKEDLDLMVDSSIVRMSLPALANGEQIGASWYVEHGEDGFDKCTSFLFEYFSKNEFYIGSLGRDGSAVITKINDDPVVKKQLESGGKIITSDLLKNGGARIVYKASDVSFDLVSLTKGTHKVVRDSTDEHVFATNDRQVAELSRDPQSKSDVVLTLHNAGELKVYKLPKLDPEIQAKDSYFVLNSEPLIFVQGESVGYFSSDHDLLQFNIQNKSTKQFTRFEIQKRKTDYIRAIESGASVRQTSDQGKLTELGFKSNNLPAGVVYFENKDLNKPWLVINKDSRSGLISLSQSK